MNCDCPPSRCGGTTMRRATMLAALAPSSVRTMCRAASMPAAVPAPVTTLPSCTKSTSGSTSVFGNSSARRSVYIQWVVDRRPSSTPGMAERERARAHREHPGAAVDGVADDVEHALVGGGADERGGHGDEVGLVREVEALRARRRRSRASSGWDRGRRRRRGSRTSARRARCGRCRRPRRSRRIRTAPSAGGRCRRWSGARDPPNGRNRSFGGYSATVGRMSQGVHLLP